MNYKICRHNKLTLVRLNYRKNKKGCKIMKKNKSINDIQLNVIERWLRNNNPDVRQAAMNACQGRDVPLNIIKYGLEDADWGVRRAAINACQGRDDMPVEVIERWLNDDSSEVRQAAIHYCEQWYDFDKR